MKPFVAVSISSSTSTQQMLDHYTTRQWKWCAQRVKTHTDCNLIAYFARSKASHRKMQHQTLTPIAWQPVILHLSSIEFTLSLQDRYASQRNCVIAFNFNATISITVNHVVQLKLGLNKFPNQQLFCARHRLIRLNDVLLCLKQPHLPTCDIYWLNDFCFFNCSLKITRFLFCVNSRYLACFYSHFIHAILKTKFSFYLCNSIYQITFNWKFKLCLLKTHVWSVNGKWSFFFLF